MAILQCGHFGCCWDRGCDNVGVDYVDTGNLEAKIWRTQDMEKKYNYLAMGYLTWIKI